MVVAIGPEGPLAFSPAIGDGKVWATCGRISVLQQELAYLGSPVTEDKVCALFDADPESTPASHVRCLHRWHFQVTYSRASLADLHQWLQQGSLPIVFVETGFLDYWQTMSVMR